MGSIALRGQKHYPSDFSGGLNALSVGNAVEPRAKFFVLVLAVFSWAGVQSGAQQPVLHEGGPALKFEAEEGWVTFVRYLQHAGEPALRFSVRHVHADSCKGLLYVTRSRIAYEPVYSPEFKGDAANIPRGEIQEAKGAGSPGNQWIKIVLPDRTLRFRILYERGSERDAYPLGRTESDVIALFDRSIADFGAVAEAFQRITMGGGPAAAAPPASPAPPLPPASPQRIRVTASVQAAKKIHHVDPDYPLRARQLLIEGIVRVEAIIGKDGRMESVSVLSGHPMLEPGTVEAIKQWRYEPTLVNNEPVEVITQIEVHFSVKRPPR